MFMPTDRKLRSRNAIFSRRRFLMLRWWWGGVGWGMLTFVWSCWSSWCYADDGVGWGGVGWGGVGHANVRVKLLKFLMLRWWWGGVGWGGVGWGGVGHVNVRVKLLKFLMLRWWWGGVGWGGVGHVNVRVKLLKFLMLRWWWCGVGWGMLTFVWSCWSSWCYADAAWTSCKKFVPRSLQCSKCGLDSLLQNVAMEIHPQVQKT